MKYREQRSRSSRHSPDLVLAYLQYALDDVQALSERSARSLELAIKTLDEDTSVIRIKQTTSNIWPS
jgi:hypothetical protein